MRTFQADKLPGIVQRLRAMAESAGKAPSRKAAAPKEGGPQNVKKARVLEGERQLQKLNTEQNEEALKELRALKAEEEKEKEPAKCIVCRLSKPATEKDQYYPGMQPWSRWGKVAQGKKQVYAPIGDRCSPCEWVLKRFGNPPVDEEMREVVLESRGHWPHWDDWKAAAAAADID